MDEQLIQHIANKFGSPMFIMQEQNILQRFCELQNAATNRYPHAVIGISYKTNLLHGLLALLHQAGAIPEVVSGSEYEVAKKIRQPNQPIIFNGPMKLNGELIQAIHDNSFINCDHLDEIERVEQVATSLQRRVPIGIRVYFNDSDVKWNRFGFPIYGNHPQQPIFEIVKKIINSPHLQLAGLHIHIGTNIRDIAIFQNMSIKLNEFAGILKQQFAVELQWLDVGGGLAGISPRIEENRMTPHPLPDIQSYVDAIILPLTPYLTSLQKPAALFFEPGRTIFEAFGSLLTRVIGKRQNEDGTPCYILDAGINILSTSYVYDFPIQTFSHQQPFQKSSLVGPTCNQQDQLHTPLELPALHSDDYLLFHGVGSYCMAFSYSFIRLRPGVVLWRGGDNVVWLRHPETLAHQSTLEEFPTAVEVMHATA
jgi:diaminopimelate decarboxylase